MENKEWLDEYASLKQVNPNNPFTVPVGYFEELDQRVMSAIKLDELKNTIPLDCFTVPENYFEELSNNIQSRVAVEAILDQDKTGFTVPENYFDELNNNIKSRLLVEQAINKAEDTFTVPQDYFNSLNKNILNKTVNHDNVKRKGAVIRMITSNVFKYATAACFVLMIGGGIFLSQFESADAIHKRSFLHQQLSTVSADDIQSYVQQTIDGNDAQHTVAAEGLSVNDAGLKAALQDYSDNNN